MSVCQNMNVYDFDGTIYDGDCTVDFFLFALKHKPSLIRFFPKQATGFLLYGMKRIGKTQMKEYFFSFLSGVDAQKLVKDFWKQNKCKIYEWYLKQWQADDMIISASPEFLLEPICRKMGVRHLIASRVDVQSGKFFGENCRGEEKVRRLAAEYHITHIDNFYSDSYSDFPMARIANRAFLAKKGILREWKGIQVHEQR